ncbi:MAG TPA: hypothetical protein IAA63_08330 [Candidatus Pullilachnospira stercoravium]|uniref:Uncharacterized protein n=1 Tax=Candidatus Pullilachnospira stercoravium TaxID=2840913 RepID=A0A9D1NUL6_9FIRM|nr:hypothetical protein [Candidatus Pullilachnospira stercoravium]
MKILPQEKPPDYGKEPKSSVSAVEKDEILSFKSLLLKANNWKIYNRKRPTQGKTLPIPPQCRSKTQWNQSAWRIKPLHTLLNKHDS